MTLIDVLPPRNHPSCGMQCPNCDDSDHEWNLKQDKDQWVAQHLVAEGSHSFDVAKTQAHEEEQVKWAQKYVYSDATEAYIVWSCLTLEVATGCVHCGQDQPFGNAVQGENHSHISRCKATCEHSHDLKRLEVTVSKNL